jgi:hypothetical protein
MTTVADIIRHLEPCAESVPWTSRYVDPAAAWRECPYGQWMLWLIGKTVACPPWSAGRKPLLSCGLDCAETVRHLWPAAKADDLAGAVGVLRAWIAGEATLRAARDARMTAFKAADATVAGREADAIVDAAHAVAYAANIADAEEFPSSAHDPDYTAPCATQVATYTAYAFSCEAYTTNLANGLSDDDAGDRAEAEEVAALARIADIVRRHFPGPPAIDLSLRRR